MANVKVYNMSGAEVGTMDLSDSIFGIDVNMAAMHTAVVQFLANQRQGTKSTLTRAEVRGGGKKPWRQKGNGRARQGSTRAPQWRGGGVVWAPKPRDYSFKVNKKVKRLALKSALTTKVMESKFLVLDELNLSQIKTKEMKKMFDNLKVKKALLVIDGVDKNVILSTRNIQGVQTTSANIINVYDILKYDMFVVTKAAVKTIEEVYV